MSNPTSDILFPRSFVLPTSESANPTIKGQMVISGTSILWYDGESVNTISGSNTGDAE